MAKFDKSRKQAGFNWKLYVFGFLFLGAILSLFFGFGDALFFKGAPVRILLVFLVFLIIPFIGWQFLKACGLRRELLNKMIPLSILIIGPCFGLWTKDLFDKDMKEYYVTKKGIITQRRRAIGVGKRHRVNIKAIFRYNGLPYETFAISVDSDDPDYEIGDSILVRFSSRNPENNELIIENY